MEIWEGGLAKGIINNCEIVGEKDDNAILWKNEKIYNLFHLITNPNGWVKLNIAYEINDNGEIVGHGFYNGAQTAFMLTPVPK